MVGIKEGYFQSLGQKPLDWCKLKFNLLSDWVRAHPRSTIAAITVVGGLALACSTVYLSGYFDKSLSEREFYRQYGSALANICRRWSKGEIQDAANQTWAGGRDGIEFTPHVNFAAQEIGCFVMRNGKSVFPKNADDPWYHLNFATSDLPGDFIKAAQNIDWIAPYDSGVYLRIAKI